MSDISSKVVDIIVDKLGVDAAEVVPYRKLHQRSGCRFTGHCRVDHGIRERI